MRRTNRGDIALKRDLTFGDLDLTRRSAQLSNRHHGMDIYILVSRVIDRPSCVGARYDLAHASIARLAMTDTVILHYILGSPCFHGMIARTTAMP